MSNTFTLEVCSIWKNSGPHISTNFSMYFLFNADNQTQYFNMPSLALRIMNRGEYDKQSVTLYVDYIEQMNLYNVFYTYLNNNTQAIGNTFSNGRYVIKMEPEPGSIPACKITLAEITKNTSLFMVVDMTTISNITNTLYNTVSDLQKTTLNCIMLVENRRLTQELRDIKGILTNINSKIQDTPIDYVPNNVNNLPITNEGSLHTEVVTENIVSHQEPNITQKESPVDETQPTNLQNELNNVITNIKQNKNDPIIIKEAIILYFKELIKTENKISPAAFQDFFETMNIYCPELPSYEQFSKKYISMRSGALSTYLHTLCYLTNTEKAVPNHPMYAFKLNMVDEFCEKFEYIAKGLSDVFFEYAEKMTANVVSPDDLKIFKMCRVLFAPIWITYIGYCKDMFQIDTSTKQRQMIRTLISKHFAPLVSEPFWSKNYMSTITNFAKSIDPDVKVFNMSAEIENPITQFFNIYFYSYNVVTNPQDFMPLRNEIQTVIDQICASGTFSELSGTFNFDKYSKAFLIAISLFTADTKDQPKTLQDIETNYKNKITDDSFRIDTFIEVLKTTVSL